MDMDTKTVEARVRVRYAETDQMGIVYHANYLVWFEVGRVELIRAMGLDYKKMEQETGCMIAVVEATARYRSPARYDDELVVETRLNASRGSVIRFGYRVVRPADSVLLCEGRDGACGGRPGDEEDTSARGVRGPVQRVPHCMIGAGGKPASVAVGRCLVSCQALMRVSICSPRVCQSWMRRS